MIPPQFRLGHVRVAFKRRNRPFISCIDGFLLTFLNFGGKMHHFVSGQWLLVKFPNCVCHVFYWLKLGLLLAVMQNFSFLPSLPANFNFLQEKPKNTSKVVAFLPSFSGTPVNGIADLTTLLLVDWFAEKLSYVCWDPLYLGQTSALHSETSTLFWMAVKCKCY